LPALAENASTVRHSLDDWAHAIQLPPGLIEVMSLAVYEAMANAVEHAYRDREPGALRMHATVTPPGESGTVVVTVEDDGRWRSPDSEPGLRGRGIPLMEALAGMMHIAPTSRGTTVRMTWQADAFSGDEGTV
jgi:serine/threonine-protein kinase RsbW